MHFDILAGTNNIKARTYSAMLRVAGHELTHFIQNRSPTKYNTLKRETLDFLKSEKSDYTEWLREKIRKKQEANAPFGKMTVEQATDEIVSDAFESVLANEEFITRLYASDAGLTKRVNNWANKYYKQFSEGLKSAFATDELTEAGKIMRAAGERAQKVYEHWIDAFAHATRNAMLFEPQAELIRNMVREAERENREYSKPITVKDVGALRSIGRKSVNEFTTEDLKKSEKWAYKYREIGTKSPFFRAWFGEWRAHSTDDCLVAEIPEYVATNAARREQRGTVKNNDTKWDIRISREGQTNTIAHSGEGRLSEYGLAGIRELVEKSVLLDTEVHEHHSNNAKEDRIAFNHKLYALGEDSAGTIALYKITVEEHFADPKHPHSMRFHNLKYIEKVADNISSLTRKNKAYGAESTNDVSTTAYSVADLYEFVKISIVYAADTTITVCVRNTV